MKSLSFFGKVLKSYSNKKVIEHIISDCVPAAVGPYGHACKYGDLVWASGQLGIVPETGEFPSENVLEQTQQVMMNLKNVLESCGTSFKNVVKSTVLLTDINDFQDFNGVYASFFNEEDGYPARACYSVKGLPKGAKVEIEMYAVCPEE